jgi:guanylate kinase
MSSDSLDGMADRPTAEPFRGERTTAGDQPEPAHAMLVIISGPSGVGKDTIIEALQKRGHRPEYHYVVTCTTRARRPNEIDGVSYNFVTLAEFAALRDAGDLLEANEVHGNWYGTPKAGVRSDDPCSQEMLELMQAMGERGTQDGMAPLSALAGRVQSKKTTLQKSLAGLKKDDRRRGSIEYGVSLCDGALASYQNARNAISKKGGAR